MKEAFIIAKNLPGTGNPLHLPVDEFNDYLIEIGEYYEQQNKAMQSSNSVDHRSFVEQQMKALGHG